MTPVFAALAMLLLGYVLGSVQPGLIVGQIYRGIDLREYGSGKTGFTNALRTLGLGPAIIVVTVDITKGAAPVLIARLLFESPWPATLAGVGAVVGHTWPLFAQFRGGRGVATAFGAFFVMAPLAALLAVVAGVVLLAITRYVSVMSMVGVAFGLLAMVAFVQMGWLDAEYLLFGVAVTLSVELNHLGNLRRLLAGTEPKLGQGGAPRAPRGA
jgi:glycerol-3-phosphate acyltransferase PlsY